MGTFVHPAKLLWELLSTVPKWNGNFCPQCQTGVGTFVHPVKNGMGTFVRGNYCPIIRLSKRSRHKQLGVSKALAVGQVASCLCQPTLAVLLLQLPLQLMWAVPQTPRAQEGDDTLVTGISEMTVI